MVERIIDENGVDRTSDWTYKKRSKDMTGIAGNMNAAVAMGAMMRLQRLEKEVKEDRMVKASKEEHLREIRALRRDLGLPDLPDYNTSDFSDEVGKA